MDDVHRWLVDAYPQLEYAPRPRALTEVVKRNKRRVRFDRRKLERSIGIASKGRGSREQVRRFATEVAGEVQRVLGDQPLVTTGQISTEVLRSLKSRDAIAYLRFASTVKGFRTAEDYETELGYLR